MKHPFRLLFITDLAFLRIYLGQEGSSQFSTLYDYQRQRYSVKTSHFLLTRIHTDTRTPAYTCAPKHTVQMSTRETQSHIQCHSPLLPRGAGDHTTSPFLLPSATRQPGPPVAPRDFRIPSFTAMCHDEPFNGE